MEGLKAAIEFITELKESSMEPKVSARKPRLRAGLQIRRM